MRSRWLVWALLVVSLLAAGSLTYAAGSKMDIGSYVKESMQVNVNGDQGQICMWTPFELFIQCALMENGVTRDAAEKDLGFLKPYQIVIVQCSSTKPDGTPAYATEQSVRARTVLRCADGTELKPLTAVPPTITDTVDTLRAFIGTDHKHAYIMVFPALDKQGKVIADSTQKGKFTVVLKAAASYPEAVFTWRTPFDSMSSVPPCKKCGEPLSAKWTYCPYCGTKIP